MAVRMKITQNICKRNPDETRRTSTTQHMEWEWNEETWNQKTDEIFLFITCQFADAILFYLFLSKMFVRSLNIKCMISLHILIVERWNQRNTLQYQFVWLIVAKRERICHCAYWQMIGFYELVKLAIDSFLLGRPICARTLANGVSYQIRQMFRTLSWCYMLSQIWIAICITVYLFHCLFEYGIIVHNCWMIRTKRFTETGGLKDRHGLWREKAHTKKRHTSGGRETRRENERDPFAFTYLFDMWKEWVPLQCTRRWSGSRKRAKQQRTMS